MERYKFIYLTGLIAMILCLSSLLFWLVSPQPLLATLGFYLSFLTFLISGVGVYHMFKYYNDKSASKNTLRSRRKHFLGHTITLSLGLAFSWVTFSTFQAQGAAPGASTVTVTVSNTSDMEIKDLHFSLGGQKKTVKALKGRESKDFKFKIGGTSTFSANLTEDGLKREAAIAVAEDNHRILLRIDYQHNLLPEVR